MLRNLPNRIAVQLFKHVPWLAARWARGHRFVEADEIPWARMGETFAVTQQRAILETALRALETVTEPGTILEPGWPWRRHRFE